MSCIDLIFCTNINVISKHGLDASIFEKCHHIVSFGKVDIRVPLPPAYVHKVWQMQMLKISKKQYPVLIGIKHLKIFRSLQKRNFERNLIKYF